MKKIQILNKSICVLVLFAFPSVMKAQTLSLQLTPSNYNNYNISCFSMRDGSIDLTVSGGTAPYTYQWSNGATTEDISGVAASYYRIHVTDANNDYGDGEITLTEPEPLKMEISLYQYPNGYNISLFGACNGSVTLIMHGGVSPFTYLWSDANTNQNRTNLCARNYGVLATDANGCEVSSEKIYLTEPQRLDWQITGNANTNPATNFIGTSDNQDFSLRTYSQERLRILANGGLKASSLAGTGSGVVLTDANGVLSRQSIVIPVLQCNDPFAFLWQFKQSVNPNVAYTCWNQVGIGTDDPQSNLGVKGSARFFNYLNHNAYVDMGHDGAHGMINSTDDVLINYFSGKNVAIGELQNHPASLYVTNEISNSGNSYLATGSGKKVGIGTTSVQSGASVEVKNSGDTRVYITQDGNGSASLNLNNNTGNWHISGPRSGESNNPLSVFWNTGGASGTYDRKFTITDQGRVGIGTSAPGEKLQIDNGNALIRGTNNFSGASDEATLFLGDNNHSIKSILGQGVSISTFNAPDLIFLSQSNSNVGVARTNPNYRLDVNGTVNASEFRLNGNLLTASQWQPGTVNSNDIYYDAGNVGIGSSSGYPREQLQIGDRWTFHNGGSKVIGYNFHYNGNSVRLVDGYSQTIGLDAYGNIVFNTADYGTAGTTISYHNGIVINSQGNVAIGTWSVPDNSYKLSVCGNVRCKKVKVETGGWCDFVFDKKYNLMPLISLDEYIKENRHLPEIPTTSEIEANGMDVGELIKKQMQKIEELTLYVIDIKKENESLKSRIQKLEDGK